jgi:hypothetical protein
VPDILKQRTEDIEIKRYAVDYMRNAGSVDYTRQVLRQLQQQLEEALAALGGNPDLLRIIRYLAEAVDATEAPPVPAPAPPGAPAPAAVVSQGGPAASLAALRIAVPAASPGAGMGLGQPGRPHSPASLTPPFRAIPLKLSSEDAPAD